MTRFETLPGRRCLRLTRILRLPALTLSTGLLWGVLVQPAAADFRVCNSTESRVGIAVGYKNEEGWLTEGWWNLKANSCETILRGDLAARYYYVYGIDYDLGGEWSGEAFMCTQDRMFTIKGIDRCGERGYVRTGFLEIDTREQSSWTVQLTDPTVDGASEQ